MTNADTAPLVLLVSKLGIDKGSHQCKTLIGARRKYAQLAKAGQVDQGAIYANGAPLSAGAIEYLGRA
jgi:hypothetical protein